MNISNSQLSEISNSLRAQFVQKTMAFLKTNFVEWAEPKANGDIEQYTKMLIAYAQDCNIKTEINIITFIICVIENNLILPLPPELSETIMNSHEDENARIELFYLVAVSATYKLVQLKINSY